MYQHSLIVKKKNFFVFENANETLKDAEHKNVSVEIYRGQPRYLH